MAIYVASDAHGHVRALDEALSKISLTSDDTLYVLGDMIDRGPDPVGVIKLVRSLPNARVLKGNHEQIMLDAIIGQDPLDAETWDINGGWTTREQLNDMEFEAYEELVRWMAEQGYICRSLTGEPIELPGEENVLFTPREVCRGDLSARAD